MAKLRQPSEIAPKRTISVLIYGQPGIGKTTLGCSAPNAVLFDYDGGVNRINPAHMIPTLQVESWEDTYEALEMLESDPQLSGVQSIVIDTVGKMLDFMSESIMRTNPKMKQYDGTLSLKGYGQRKKMFVDFIHMLAVKGKNVIFIAHEKEEKDGDATIKRPLVGGSSASDLLQELDLVGYMQARGNNRTLTFNPTDAYYAKNSCYISDCNVPVVVDANGQSAKPNDFLSSAVFKAFRDAQERKVELTRKYTELVSEIEEAVRAVNDVDDLNNLVKSLAKVEYIYDARIRTGLVLKRKAEELGAKLDKESKTYVVA